MGDGVALRLRQGYAGQVRCAAGFTLRLRPLLEGALEVGGEGEGEAAVHVELEALAGVEFEGDEDVVGGVGLDEALEDVVEGGAGVRAGLPLRLPD
jgi:hypothetical protein